MINLLPNYEMILKISSSFSVVSMWKCWLASKFGKPLTIGRWAKRL